MKVNNQKTIYNSTFNNKIIKYNLLKTINTILYLFFSISYDKEIKLHKRS